MNFTMPEPGQFVFDPHKLSEGMITIENCKAYTASIERMNLIYITFCVCMFILWIITAYKAGMLDKEVKKIKELIKH